MFNEHLLGGEREILDRTVNISRINQIFYFHLEFVALLIQEIIQNGNCLTQ